MLICEVCIIVKPGYNSMFTILNVYDFFVTETLKYLLFRGERKYGSSVKRSLQRFLI